MSLKVLELFGGIGAPRKALERLGIDFEVVDYVEIDKYAVKSYNAMYGENYEPQDITTWDKDIEVDMIFHGSPCQDFSLAGKQAGGDKDSGTRSSLLYETIRIVEKLKPKYVVWENVKNVISKKHRHNFDNYLEEMNRLGYTNYYQVLNAKDYGIPQNRERVFTVSILNGDNYEFPKGDECDNSIKVVGNYMPSGHNASRIVDEDGLAPTVKENHGTVTAVLQRFEFPPKQELKLRLKDMLEDEVDEKYYLSDEKIRYMQNTNHKKFIDNNLELEPIDYRYDEGLRNRVDKNLIPTLTCKVGTTGFSGQPLLKIREATKKGYKEAYDEDSVNQAVVEPFITKKYKEFEKSKGYIPNMFNPYNKSEINDIAPTQSTQCGSTTSSATVLIKNDLRIRKLTPKECWRLMGFDDEDFDKASKVNSNAQLYKQAGNSIVVNVLEAIFKNLLG